MSETKTPPASVTIKFCPVCGRNDRYVPFVGKSHFFLGTRCRGELLDVKYALVRAGTFSPNRPERAPGYAIHVPGSERTHKPGISGDA